MTLLVPYRDREEHLKEFVSSMKGDDTDYWSTKKNRIIVVEQADDKPFNRGKLINVGYLETGGYYFAAHDIDMIDVKVDYHLQESQSRIMQLATSGIQKIDYLGGVTAFYTSEFSRLGGYHNDFWHRAEDNEMMFHIKRMKSKVLLRPGLFRHLPHERTSPEFIPELWQKAQAPRTKDMLKTCEYKLISKELKDGYTHLKVEL